jgi:hypothetical protein
LVFQEISCWALNKSNRIALLVTAFKLFSSKAFEIGKEGSSFDIHESAHDRKTILKDCGIEAMKTGFTNYHLIYKRSTGGLSFYPISFEMCFAKST